jgi:hypothetical protein
MNGLLLKGAAGAWLLGTLLALNSCRPPAPPGDDLPYPDIKGWVAAYADSLQVQGYALDKQVRTGLQVDSVALDAPDWAAELAGFSSYDLASPVQRGRYLVDSSQDRSGAWRVRYEAAGTDPSLRRVLLLRDENGPVWFYLLDSVHNALYSARKVLYLHLDSGWYRMDLEQRSWLFRDLEQQIEGQVRRR